MCQFSAYKYFNWYLSFLWFFSSMKGKIYFTIYKWAMQILFSKVIIRNFCCISNNMSFVLHCLFRLSFFQPPNSFFSYFSHVVRMDSCSCGHRIRQLTKTGSSRIPNSVQNSIWPKLSTSEYLPEIFQIWVEGIGCSAPFYCSLCVYELGRLLTKYPITETMNKWREK